MTTEASYKHDAPTVMTYVRVGAGGFAAGLRSVLPLAVLVRKQRAAAPGVLTSGPARTLLALAAAGEIVGDKIPSAPSRLTPAPFGFRILLGALTGGIIASSEGLALPVGVVLGAAGAGLGTWAGTTLRKTLVEQTPVPDQFWAVVEDITAGRLAAVAAA